MRKVQTHSPSAEAFDRGRAKYFHGREKILADFRDALWRAKHRDGGTTFLIQGAPGAGKTALLYKCKQLAEKRKWKVAQISSLAFWNHTELRSCLGSKGLWMLTGGSLQIGAGGFGKIGGTVNRESEAILKRIQSGKKPLLLTLDEAQILGMKDEFPADQINTVRHVLQYIHNGKLKRPVILIAAGLGTTKEAFGTLGISRFAKRCRVELGALGKEAERAVLHDWLTKDGNATGNTTAWIDAIAKETHGWPQHILSYIDPALDQLHADKGVMTADGLATVLEAGRALRTAYYRGRVERVTIKQRRSFAKLFANVAYGGGLEFEDIMMSLAQDHGTEKAEKIFRRAEEKGVIIEKDGLYVVPIPSMHDWLVSNYARIQVKGTSDRPLGQLRNVGGRDSGRGLER